MTREEMDFIGSMNMCDEISNEAYQKIMAHCEEQEPCDDCISRQAAIDGIADLKKSPWFNDDTTEAKVIRKEAVEIIEDLCIKSLPSVTPQRDNSALERVEMRESCGDCISREETINKINTLIAEYIPLMPTGWTLPLNIARTIKELPSVTPQQTRWIPVSERLPKEREWYLAVFKEIDTEFQLIPRVADYIGNGKNEWRIIDEDGLVREYRSILECVAWMPLPEPYQGGESDAKQ